MARLPALLLSMFVVTLSGCALIAGLRDPDHVDEEIQVPGARRPGDGAAEGSASTSPEVKPCAADVTSDANNCGWCGHACGGGACRGGLCESTKLSGTSPSALVADDESIFFITGDEVRACSARGLEVACRPAIDRSALDAIPGWGAPPELEPRALALYGDRLFVLDEAYEAVIACPKSRCDAASVGLVDIGGSTDPTGSLSVGPTRIVWGESGGIGSAEPPAPAGVTRGALLEAPASPPSRVHVADFTSGRREVLWLGGSGLFALGLQGGAAPSAVLAGGGVADFAIDVSSIYVASGSRVERIDRATNARSLFADVGGVSIESLVADAGGLYALVETTSDTRVLRVREGGAEPIAIANDIEHVALSERWLYYAGRAGIFRVAR